MLMNTSSLRSQRGFSLIEVLVTLVIVAISLLGLLAIQTRAFSLQSDTYNQRAASELASQLRERISGNFDGYNTGSYAMTLTLAGTPAAGPICTSACDPVTQMPLAELSQWASLLRQRIPISAASVGPLTAGGELTGVRIGIAWYEPNSTETTSNCAGVVDSVMSEPTPQRQHYRCLEVVAFPG
ncbi:N/A [soil metagenome]